MDSAPNNNEKEEKVFKPEIDDNGCGTFILDCPDLVPTQAT